MDTIEGWIEAAGLPAGVRGGTATRRFAGASAAPYGRANYGEQCGDQPDAVARNRALLRESLGLTREPLWLRQVHGVGVVVVDAGTKGSGASAALQVHGTPGSGRAELARLGLAKSSGASSALQVHGTPGSGRAELARLGLAKSSGASAALQVHGTPCSGRAELARLGLAKGSGASSALQVHGTPGSGRAELARLGLAKSSGASSALQEQGCAAPVADACVVRGRGLAAVIQTADCMPILLAADGSDELAAIHAGWRGLAAGVIEATLERMNAARATICAWLGPAIGQDAFEVGPEVRAAFVDADAGAALCFRRGREDRWHADLAGLTRRRLQALGVARISGGDLCTVSAPAQFHSFRRDGATSGRMATLVWRCP